VPNVNERRLKSENDDLKRALSALRVETAGSVSTIAKLRKEGDALALRQSAIDVFAFVAIAAEKARAAMVDAERVLEATSQPDTDRIAALNDALEAEKVKVDKTEILRQNACDRIADLAGRLDAANARRVQAEDREAALFARLTKRLPAGWQGMTARAIGEQPGGTQALHVLLVDVLSWATEQDHRKREPSAAPAKKKPSGAAYRKAKKAREV
jgi:hypothetical protein